MSQGFFLKNTEFCHFAQTWTVMPQSPETLLINKCLHLCRDYFNMFTLLAPVAVKSFFRLISDCFPRLARCVGLNTGLGNNQSAFIQTKMLCKLRCREETLLSFSGNILFKETHENITAILVEAGLLARCVQHPWACHSRADFKVCLACGLVPGLFKWGGTRG